VILGIVDALLLVFLVAVAICVATCLLCGWALYELVVFVHERIGTRRARKRT
jgi:hypothetical protein